MKKTPLNLILESKNLRRTAQTPMNRPPPLK